LYIIEGELSESDLKKICEELLTDRITQFHEFFQTGESDYDKGAWMVEVAYKPGVTDAVGDSTVKGIMDLGINGIRSAKTGKKYIIKGSLGETEIDIISKRLLANDVIQNYEYKRKDEG